MAIEGLLGPLHPSDESIERVMRRPDEEAKVELVSDEGGNVATLHVDVLTDPVNGWTIKLKGWRLADGVASV